MWYIIAISIFVTLFSLYLLDLQEMIKKKLNLFLLSSCLINFFVLLSLYMTEKKYNNIYLCRMLIFLKELC